MEEDNKKFDLLQKQIKGKVLYNELSRSLYSSGASLYRIKPKVIVQPKSKDDLVKTIKFAREHKIPITARGGGTSRTGNELGAGILIDFCKYLNQIIELNPEEKWVRIQPGIVQADLNRQLKSHNLYFPIDPSTKDSATLGGMIANNSSGPHAVKYGTTRAHINSLELVLSNGDIIETGRKPILQGSSDKEASTRIMEEEIYLKVAESINKYEKYLEPERPFVTKNSCGYYIWDLLTEDFLDLTPLMVGSEGTLALVSEATLKLSTIPEKALSGFVCFDDLGKVGEATQQILEEGPSMIEIMEKHILDLARGQYPELVEYFPENTEASLFIEFQEDSDEILRSKFFKVRKRLIEDNTLAVSMLEAKNADDMKTFTKIRSISGPILNRMKGPKRPIAFIEDAAVHVSRLPEYISGLRKLFEKFNVNAAIYGHAGDGNLHNMAILDLRRQEDVKTMIGLSDAVCDLVLSLKGTISGEHADGLLRTHYVKLQYPHLYEAMKEIKAVFDPQGLLNPGVIISDNENSLGENLKYGPDFSIVSTNSSFDNITLQEQIEKCSGCAKCRDYCPIASASLEEWTKGRGKITLLREITSGKLDPAILEDPEFKEVMDSCINCKRCLTECPSGVDVPWLAMSERTHFVKNKGETLTDRVLTETEKLCKQGSMLAPIANFANSFTPLRWGMEKMIGMEAKRYLPEFRHQTLRKILKYRTQADTNREVVFFLGCYTNYNDPEGEGLAIIDVLEHNGIKVIMPEFKCCGIARISAGAQDKVMDDIHYNIGLLKEYTAKNIPILFSEPSCALAVITEYPRIVESKDSKKVAANCLDIHQYLIALNKKGELKTDFKKMAMKVGYHAPCHLRSLGVVDEPVDLMKLIPGMKVKKYADKCCGMAGTYGLKSKNYELSMKIGNRLFDEINASDVDQVVTGCGACGMQIHQGTKRESLHPLKLLAMAYKGEKFAKE
ncbi:MAG: anaerobic glycerol-3-phosphate dehydrogenase subunit C [Desulfobacula sp.]|uniref:anaerobic glycerol-3-phosphate dehydrogenase subunit C n=1 Tax=Desulfobacula sp. TaxID=2593537 RepID=UPI001EC54E28|nr:anaerobic glycerol-3-phosphate dehydrogenase subunit C [Desulfobacula sp.]